MTGSGSESPTTVMAYNAKIDFESGTPTSPVAHGVKYSAPVANGVIYSESPKFFATNDPPSAIPEVNVHDRNKVAGMNNNVRGGLVSSKSLNHGGLSRGFIETKAPIESVKSAVSKFGGIVDWKSRRVHSMMERSMPMEKTLGEVQEEILQCRKKSVEAVEAEFHVLNELENMKQRIEELKLALETAQSEEQQAKQDSELAKLRLEEMEQEAIKENDDALAKAQLEMTMAEHAAAVSELKSVKEQLEVLRAEFTSIVYERDSAVKNADDALAASKESEKAIMELTTELLNLKELLESSQAAHLEEEEKTMVAAVAKEQDCFKWKKELDDAEVELCRLNLQILSNEDLKLKVNTASALLMDLKAEMIAYMESTLAEEISDELHFQGDFSETQKKTNSTILQKELEEVKLNIEKAIADADCLKMAFTSLKSVLEEEKSILATTKKREGMDSDAAASLEAEIYQNVSKIVVVQETVKVDLTNQLKQAAEEADRAKSLAQMARDELQKAKIEAAQAKAESIAMESRILAAQKEVEASNASKMLALSAIKALQETVKEDPKTTVTISLDEYNELSERAREAEEQASMKMTKAISQIEVAKESEAKSQEMLEEASRELVARQEALKAATEKAREAEEGKLAVEQELRIWRAEQEQQRNAKESEKVVAIPTSPRASNDVKETTGEQVDSSTPQEQEPITNEQTPTNESDKVVSTPTTSLKPSVEVKEPTTGEQADYSAPQEQEPITKVQTPTNESDQVVGIPTTISRTSDEVKEPMPGEQADSPAPEKREPIVNEQTPSNESGQVAAIPTTSPTTSVEVKEPTTSEQADPRTPQGQKPIVMEQTPTNLGRAETFSGSKPEKKKKRSFLPKMLSYLGKQKLSRKKHT